MSTAINILIIEDMADDAALLVDALETAGFEPKWQRVETKSDYLAHLGSHLDLIFSDFNLPLFSTSQALALLQERHLEIPFIIVSGTIGEERAVEALKSGATDYVLKDRPHRLGQAVERALREAREHTERKQMGEALRITRERLDRVLAHSPAVIYSLHVEGDKLTPTWISPNVSELFGNQPSGTSGRETWLNSLHPDDRSEALGGELKVLAYGQAVKEYRLKDKTGIYRWVRDEQRLLRDADGRPVEIVGSWIDITERKNLEEQFRQAQKMESIGQLAGGVAHDFNNILTVIQGNASLMKSEPGVYEAAGESIEQILHASQRAANLTRQLLTFSRKQAMQTQPLNLNEIVGNLTKMLTRVLGADISLRANYDSDLCLINADPGMMEQVLMNLAVNARDAMPNGGELLIHTSNESIATEFVQSNPQATTGEYVCLTVADTGCGMTPEILSHVFEPFFTTKGVGKGTGLGLATVYGIVKQHCGWVTVQSEVGKGTTFRIYLPIVKHPAKEKTGSIAEKAVRGGNETILLVEDEAPVRALSRNILQRYGYQVLEAESGAAALAIWQSHRNRIDLVLTDMVMPGGVSGRDLMDQLHKEKPSLRAVYTSGYSADVVGKNFKLRVGINFLQKPFAPTELGQTIRAALDQAAAPAKL